MQRTIFTVLFVLTIASLTLSIYLYFSQPKFAYVRSHDLISKYAGTIEARAKFESKRSSMVANVDSLRSMLESSRMDYMNKAGSMSLAQRSAREGELSQQQNQFLQYSAAIEERIAEEDKQMMGAVLNQVNSFVEEYARTNDIDVILGTTLTGSLLYGEDSMDITEQLLESLNRKYQGK